jgi:predicted regulator of Ras-like GTPase activity (Roadblock/LC7/MglB family)
MSFLPHLQQIVSQVEGALACSVMGLDGIAVETHEVPAAAELDLTAAWIELLAPVKQLKDAAELLKTGSVQEVCVSSEKVITLMRMVSPEYFLVLALKPEGNYGRGRYALRVTAPKVKAEL